MATKAKAPHHHFALLVGQFGQPLIDALRKVVVLQQFTRIGGTIVGQGVQQGLVGVRTQGNIHRGYPLVEAEHALDLVDRLFQ
ncbi:hypothetical protein D9M69_652530 [compost metagenome]